MFNFKLLTPMFLLALSIGSATALHATPAHAAMCRLDANVSWVCAGSDDGAWACDGGDKEQCGEINGDDWNGESCIFFSRPRRCL